MQVPWCGQTLFYSLGASDSFSDARHLPAPQPLSTQDPQPLMILCQGLAGQRASPFLCGPDPVLRKTLLPSLSWWTLGVQVVPSAATSLYSKVRTSGQLPSNLSYLPVGVRFLSTISPEYRKNITFSKDPITATSSSLGLREGEDEDRQSTYSSFQKSPHQTLHSAMASSASFICQRWVVSKETQKQFLSPPLAVLAWWASILFGGVLSIILELCMKSGLMLNFKVIFAFFSGKTFEAGITIFI